MNKEFIPYEQALELKELGFNEPCILLYRGLDTQPVCQMDYYFKTEKNSDFNDETNYWFTVSTFSQAFRWFREKYNYCYFIRGNNYDGYYYDIDNLGMLRYKIEIDNRLTWKTYEEAELECLKKLIELKKNG
jgi:hypothetical protein